MKRRRIHSDIKLLEAAGALPPEYRNLIHRSQLWRYRKLSEKDFYGSDLAIVNEEDDSTDKLRKYPLLRIIIKLVVFILDHIDLLLVNGAVHSKLLEEKARAYLREKSADIYRRLFNRTETNSDLPSKHKTAQTALIELGGPESTSNAPQLIFKGEPAETVAGIESG